MSDGVKILRELADVLEEERAEYQDMRERVATILKWCETNIEDKTQVAPFCVQVRDALTPDHNEEPYE